MTSDPPPPVPRASGRPARVRRPPSPSSLLAKGVQRAGRRPDQLARWWNELEEVVLLLRAENVGAAAAGAARLSREAEQAVEEGDGGADEQWALLGAARTVLGLAHDEQPGGEPAQPVYAAAVDAFERAGTWATGRGNVVAYHGQALLGAGRPAEAAEMLRHAASGLGEDTPDVRRSLGVALARAGRLAEAENVLLDAVARAPYDWRAHRALAQTGERLDRPADVLSDRWAAAAAAHPDPDAAVAAYERARSHSATATVLLALGVSYAAAGRAADAERSLREADRMRPSGRTRLQIADMVALQGDTREAAAVAASALPLGVEEADVLVGLGAHLLAADRLHEFDRAMHGLPPALMPVVEAYQSVSLVRRGRVTEGTALLERALPAVPPDERLLLTVATTAVDAGRTDLASGALDRILKSNPASARALAMRGILCLQAGDLDAGESGLRAALGREPGLAPARAYLGELLRVSGRYDEAAPHLRRAVEDGEDEAWVLASLAEVVLVGRAPDSAAEAESLYRQALDRDPDLLDALCGLTMILLDRVDLEAQQEINRLLEHALSLDGESPLATALRGEVLRRDGRTAEAVDHFGRALDEDSEWVWGLGSWAQALRTRHQEDGDRQHLEKARRLLTRATTLSRNLTWLHTELAEVYADLDEPDRALAELRIAAKQEPGEPEHLIRQAQLHAGKGDLRKAERLYRRVLDDAPDRPGVRAELAEVLWQRRSPTAAIEMLDAALDFDPDDDDARLLRYQIHWYERRIAEAVADLNHLADRGVQVQVALADAYRLQGRFAEARSLLDEALAADPHDSDAWNVRGVVQWLQGDAEAALADLEHALDDSPLDEFVVTNLTDVLFALGRGQEAEHRLAQLGAAETPHLLPIYADVLLRAGRQEEAVQLLERVLWTRPDDVRALRGLGWALLALERGTEAVACFLRIVALRPAELDPKCDLAIAMQRSGDLATALDTVAIVVEERPDDPLGWRIRSGLQASMGDFDAAVDSATAATGCLQQTAEAYDALGWALLYTASSNRAEEALAAYRRARELDALSPWLRSGEADALYVLGDARHRRLYQETLGLIADSGDISPDLLGLRGWCLFRLGEPDAALVVLLRAVTLTNRPAHVLFDLVLVVLTTAAFADARTFFRRAIEELHQEPKLAQRGRLHVARRDLRASRANLPAAVEHVAEEFSRQLDNELAALKKGEREPVVPPAG